MRCEICGTEYESKIISSNSNTKKICSFDCFLKFVKEQPIDHEFLRFFYSTVHINVSDYFDRTHYSVRLGIGFRSGIEVQCAEKLYDAGIPFNYEQFKVASGKGFYTPDFFIPDPGLIIEVKGVWYPNGKKKFSHALSTFGREKMILLPLEVFDNDY